MSSTRFMLELDYADLIESRRSFAASLKFTKARLARLGRENAGARRALLRKLHRLESMCKRVGVPQDVIEEPLAPSRSTEVQG